jgi:hypothetical protein
MQNLVADILKQCEGASQDFVKEEAEAFLMEGKAFSETIAGDLDKWTAAYQAGKIDEAGVKRLLKRRQTTMKMQALTCAGIAEIRIEQLQNRLLDIVVGTVLKAV